MNPPVAVVEVGSGSVKLLIVDAEAAAGAAPPLVDTAFKTNLLQEAVGGAGEPEAMTATDEAFADFAASIAEFKPNEIAVIGTAVARRPGMETVIDPLVRKHFDRPLETVDGEREARLGWIGATTGRALAEPFAVLDIGSGSTELAFGTPDALRCFSLPIGAYTVTADYLHSDPPRPDELSAALSVIELHFDDVRRLAPEVMPTLAGGTVFGAGALSRLARVEIGLADLNAKVDGYRLTQSAAEEVFRALATESAEDRAFNPGLAPGDVRDIVGGLCVLVEFFRRFPCEDLVITERDVRHGRASELLGLVSTQ